MEKSKLWTRPFVTLACVNFFSILTFFLLTIKTTEYVLAEYGVAYDIAGSAVSVYIFSALAMRLVLGRKLDHWGARKALFLGCILNASASLLYLTPIGFLAFLGVRVMHGASMALITTAAAAGAALIVPPDRLAEGIGYFMLSQALATGVGPFIGILLTTASGGYDLMFLFTAFTGVASFLTFFLVSMPSVDGTGSEAADASTCGGAENAPDSPSNRLGRALGKTIQLSVLPLCSSILLTFVCYSGILGFLTVYAADKGLENAVSLYFAVYSAVILVSRPPIGRLVDRRGENSVMYFTFISFSASFVILVFATSGAGLLASAAFLGFGNGISQAVVQAIIARLTPANQLGRANSTLFICMDVGSGVAPMIIGSLILRVGYSPTFLCLAGVALVAMAVHHITHGRKPIARMRGRETHISGQMQTSDS